MHAGDDSDRSFVHTRRIDASPERLARWRGPEGFRNRFVAFDLRPGGAWRFVTQGPDGTDHANRNRFQAVEAPHRVVVEHLSDDHHFVLTITLRGEGYRPRVGREQTFATPEHERQRAPWVLPANEANLDRPQREVARRDIAPGRPLMERARRRACCRGASGSAKTVPRMCTWPDRFLR